VIFLTFVICKMTSLRIHSLRVVQSTNWPTTNWFVN